MRKPERLSLEQVPVVPDRLVASPCSNGDRVFDQGIHRWRYDKNDVLLYYIRYSDKRDRQEAVYERRRR